MGKELRDVVLISIENHFKQILVSTESEWPGMLNSGEIVGCSDQCHRFIERR